MSEDYDELRRYEAERDLQDRMMVNEAWEGCEAILFLDGTETHFAPGGAITGRYRTEYGRRGPYNNTKRYLTSRKKLRRKNSKRN